MVDVRKLNKGMAVYSADGQRIGRVLAVGSSQFQVERGRVFHRDFLVSVSDIVRLEGEHIHLRRAREDIPGVDGGYHDKGYADRGHAGDLEPFPIAAIEPVASVPDTSIPPRVEPVADVEETTARPPERPSVGRASEVGMTGDVAHPERGAPLAPALGPATRRPAEPRHGDVLQHSAHAQVHEEGGTEARELQARSAAPEGERPDEPRRRR
jgi:hypothetical protein